MSQQPPKIDISKQVMQKIDHRQISMRPRGYFVAQRMLLIVGLILASLLCVSGLVAFSYAIKNNSFSDYVQFGGLGWGQYLASIPWLGLITTLLAGVAVVWLTNQLFGFIQSRRNMVAAMAVLLIVISFGLGLGSPSSSPVSKLASGYRLGSEQQKLVGTIIKISDSEIIIETSSGIKTTSLRNVDFYHDQIPKVGDRVMILGLSKNGQLHATAIKVLEGAKVQSSLQPVRVEAQKQTAGAKVEPPKPEEVAKPQPTASQPTETPKDTSAPTPPAGHIITIGTITGPFGSGPRKFNVSWSANFTSPLGYKIVWSLSPGPTYPGSDYFYYSTASSSGNGYIKDTLGPGTYYVRVCEYLSGSCGTYSNQVTITFP